MVKGQYLIMIVNMNKERMYQTHEYNKLKNHSVSHKNKSSNNL